MRENELGRPAAAHAPRRVVTAVPHASGHAFDTERTIVECEAPDCRKQTAIADSYSFVCCLATTGPAGQHAASGVTYRIPAYQCEQEQHFCCSPDCAIKAAAYCMAHQVADLTRRHAAMQAHLAELHAAATTTARPAAARPTG